MPVRAGHARSCGAFRVLTCPVAFALVPSIPLVFVVTSREQRKGLDMRLMTAAKLKTLKRPGRYRADATLFLFIKNTGTRSWVQRLTVDGVRREIGLGGYPTVGLAEAREQAAENRRLARRGGNPLANVRQAPTFERASKRTHDANRARLSRQESARWLARLKRYAFPAIGDRRVDRIEQGDVLRVLTPVWTAKPPTARKLRAAIRATLAWCQAHGYIDHNPAGEAIDGALPSMPAVREHFRALDYRDVAPALERIARCAASVPVRACLRFTALTAVRSSEARLATWKEIDLDAREWRIPAARMKMGVEHRVPLSDPAVATLQALRSLHSPAGYVFPSLSKPTRPVSYNLSRVLEAASLDTTVHGLRAAFRTWAAEQTSFPHAVCEMALAHRVGGDVVLSYSRGDLFDKRRALMDSWAAYVTREPGNVLRFHA